MSRFMLLIFADEKRWQEVSEEEHGAIMGEYFAYTNAMVEAGAFVSGDPLHPSTTAKTVAQGGVVTDGPFADIAEHLGGYYVVDVPSIDDAVEWARRNPSLQRGLDRVEVRPVLEMDATAGTS